MSAVGWVLVAGISALIGCDPVPVIVGADCEVGRDCTAADSGPAGVDSGSPDPVNLLGAGGSTGGRRVLDGGQLTALLDVDQVVDASAQDAQLDSETGLMCEPGFYDCDGISSNGCEWDGCAMVVFLNAIACGICGEVELCGCGPSVINRDRCDFDCNGMGEGL